MLQTNDTALQTVLNSVFDKANQQYGIDTVYGQN
jgi:hypothetical protein